MAEDEKNEAQLPLDGIGVRLRRAREAAGLSRADIATSTKIPERHLSAMEEGNFAALPARTYAVGFSRSYAKAVGLDEAEIARAVRLELSGQEPEHDRRQATTFDPGDPARFPTARMAWIAALAALIVVAVGAAVWRSYYAPAVTLAPLGEPTPAATAAPAPQPQPASGAVVFTALDDGVWVKFYDAAGTQLFQKQLARGESYTVPAEAQDPQIWTARPQALAITVGGRPVPRLSETQVTMKDVPVSAAALLARAQPQVASAAAAPTPTRSRAETRRETRDSARGDASPAAPTDGVRILTNASPTFETPVPAPPPSTVTP